MAAGDPILVHLGDLVSDPHRPGYFFFPTNPMNEQQTDRNLLAEYFTQESRKLRDKAHGLEQSADHAKHLPPRIANDIFRQLVKDRPFTGDFYVSDQR